MPPDVRSRLKYTKFDFRRGSASDPASKGRGGIEGGEGKGGGNGEGRRRESEGRG